MNNSAWLHGESAVPLCSWMSTCSTTLSPSTSLWTSVYFLLHQLSWLQPPRTRPRYCHNTPFLTGRPSPPLSRVSPQTPAVNHLCLSCSPPHAVLSYLQPAQQSFWYCVLTYKHLISIRSVEIICHTGLKKTKKNKKFCMSIIERETDRVKARWRERERDKWDFE